MLEDDSRLNRPTANRVMDSFHTRVPGGTSSSRMKLQPRRPTWLPPLFRCQNSFSFGSPNIFRPFTHLCHETVFRNVRVIAIELHDRVRPGCSSGQERCERFSLPPAR